LPESVTTARHFGITRVTLPRYFTPSNSKITREWISNAVITGFFLRSSFPCVFFPLTVQALSPPYAGGEKSPVWSVMPGYSLAQKGRFFPYRRRLIRKPYLRGKPPGRGLNGAGFASHTVKL
jgi:hypothetical protein